MTFWDSAKLEPKRSFKFYVNFGSKFGLQRWMVKTIDLPSFEVSETAHTYLNYEYYFPGKVTWSEIGVTLVDPVNKDAAEAFIKGLKAGGYAPPSSNGDTLETVSKADMVTHGLGSEMEIVQITAAGAKGEGGLWKLHNPWIKKVEFGKHSYEEEGLLELTMTIKYDYAKYLKGGKNVADSVS